MGLGLGQAGISGDSVTSGKDTFGLPKEGGRCRSDSVRLREMPAVRPCSTSLLKWTTPSLLAAHVPWEKTSTVDYDSPRPRHS